MKEIKNKKQASEFLGIPENEMLNFYKYNNGDWEYRDENKYYHLFRLINREWIELTENVKAIYVLSFNNGDWGYADEYGCYHLFRKIGDEYIELTKNVRALDVDSYDNGDWEYRDENCNWRKFNKNNKLIKKITHENSK